MLIFMHRKFGFRGSALRVKMLKGCLVEIFIFEYVEEEIIKF